MPPFGELLSVHFDPAAVVVLAVSGFLYGWGVRRARRNGVPWPTRRTVVFVVLGMGSYAAVSFGFLGAQSAGLRWAFVLRCALLLLFCPGLAALGRPVALVRAAAGPDHAARVDAVIDSKPLRLLGNTIVAPLVPLALFMLFLTPFAGAVRVSVLGEAGASVLLPVIGLLLFVTLIEQRDERTTEFFAAEFMIGFVELVLDALPGILLRLSGAILDGVTRIPVETPSWYPSPLRDQQLAGDLLWLVAEVGDLPALILLIARWARRDRADARGFDDLTDEEYADLTRDHLRGPREGT